MQEERKVIQLIDSLNVGGAEMMAVNIANSLTQSNQKTFLCSTREEGDLKKNLLPEVEYLFLNKKKTFDFSAVQLLIQFLKKNDIKIIHVHTTSLFFSCLVKLLYSPIKIVWHNHTGANTNSDLKRKIFLKSQLFFTSKVINVSFELNEWVKQKLKFKNSYFIQNFSNLNSDLKRTTLKGHKDFRIVCVAGFRSEKNHLNLVQAFKKVQSKIPEATLHLVGKLYQSEYTKSVYDLVELYKISDKVHFYGACSDVSNILKQSSVGVLSSDSEGLPVSLLEYGMSNLPIVVTDVGQCSTVLENGKYGELVPIKNAEALGNAIIKTLENKEESLQKADLLSEYLKENYSKRVILKQIQEIYYSC
ncbi:glycosyltransferase [Aureivirga sp. CE67]|uniref:glycosyltransferase n=1 Tax=Aureivirga sp. CE67 TaxID=1788983 RepID=UPI0018CAD355|nr:glycosyltransferase [Aureivirga sp. CE67]